MNLRSVHKLFLGPVKPLPLLADAFAKGLEQIFMHTSRFARTMTISPRTPIPIS